MLMELVYFGESAACVAGVTDEVGETDAAIGVAEEGEGGDLGEALVAVGEAVEVADFVLGEGAGPAGDGGDGGFRDGAEDAAELCEGGCCDFGVGGLGEKVGGGAAEEGAEDAGVGWGAVGEFLVDECGGEEGGVGRYG